LSDGATLRANIGLLENNARVAATIARALQNRERWRPGTGPNG
jgi:pseudouridine-5'-phosphate glycosidase